MLTVGRSQDNCNRHHVCCAVHLAAAKAHGAQIQRGGELHFGAVYAGVLALACRTNSAMVGPECNHPCGAHRECGDDAGVDDLQSRWQFSGRWAGRQVAGHVSSKILTARRGSGISRDQTLPAPWHVVDGSGGYPAIEVLALVLTTIMWLYGLLGVCQIFTWWHFHLDNWFILHSYCQFSWTCYIFICFGGVRGWGWGDKVLCSYECGLHDRVMMNLIVSSCAVQLQNTTSVNVLSITVLSDLHWFFL